MKKVNLIWISVLAVLILNTTACKNNIQEKIYENAYIGVAVENDAVRTILPSFEKETLTNFELKAKPAAADGEEISLGTWNNYETLSAAKISIDAGTYNFTLKAEAEGNKFSGSLENVIIKDGYQTLSFTLLVDSYAAFTESEKGSLSYTVSFDDDFYKVKEVWIFWDFYKNYNKNKAYGNKQKLSFTEIEDGTRHCTAVFSKNDFDCCGNGSDIAVCFKIFYEDTTDGVVPENSFYTIYSEIIKLLPGRVVEESHSLEIPDGVHNISYVLNLPDEADSSLLEGNLKKSFLETDRKLVLNDISYTHLTFEGFYKSADLSNRIYYLTEDDLKDDIILYVKWSDPEIYTITYDYGSSYGGAGTDAPVNYDYFTDTHISDPVNSKSYLTFAGWTITNSADEVLCDLKKDFTIEHCNYDSNLKFTANWIDERTRSKIEDTSKTIATYDIIYADDTFSTLEEFNSWDEEAQTAAKAMAVGVVYDATNRYMVAIKNESPINVSYNAQMNACLYSRESVDELDICGVTNWEKPKAADAKSVLENRVALNEVIAAVGGTPLTTTVNTGYWADEYEQWTSGTRYVTGVLITESNDVSVYARAWNFKDDYSGYYTASNGLQSYNLGWMAIKQY